MATDNPSGRKEIKVAMTLTELGEIRNLVAEQTKANKVLETIGGSLASVAAALKDLQGGRTQPNIQSAGTHPPTAAAPEHFFGSGGPIPTSTASIPTPAVTPVTPSEKTGGPANVPKNAAGVPQFVQYDFAKQLRSMANPAQYGGRYTVTQGLQQLQKFSQAKSHIRMYDRETGQEDFGVEMNPDHIDPVTPTTMVAHEEFFNKWSKQRTPGVPVDRNYKVFTSGGDVRFGSEITDQQAQAEGYEEQTDSKGVRDALALRAARQGGKAVSMWGGIGGLAGRAITGGSVLGLGAMAAQALYSTTQKLARSGPVSGWSREGQQLGFARDANPFNIGAGENEALGSRWQAFKASWGGLNPFLSDEQATAARNAVHGLGYSGRERDLMVNNVNELTQYSGLDPTRTAEMTDRAYRSGSASLEGFRRTLEGIPAAAKAARMGVAQFQDSLDQAAQQSSAATGVPYAKAADTIMAQQAGTGMQAGKFESQTLDWMGASRAGVSIGRYLLHPELRAAGNIDAANYYLSQLGGDTKRLATDPQFQEQVMGNLSMSGGVLPNTNLTFEDLMKMAADPGQVNRTQAEATLSAYAPKQGNIVTMGGIGDVDNPANRQKYDAMIRSTLQTAGIAGTDINKALDHKDPNKVLSAARELVGADTRAAAGKARDQVAVSLDFAPGVQDILMAAINGDGSDKYGDGKRTFVPSANARGSARPRG